MRQRSKARDTVQGPSVFGEDYPAARLEATACNIRRLSLQMIFRAGSGNPGGALSAAEVLAYLYFQELKLDVRRPGWPGRDRFILSKGHAFPSVYAALGLRGCFGPDPGKAWATFGNIDGMFQGHPHVVNFPWVETSTGSLGQGFSVAIGAVLELRARKLANRIYVMLGGGELQDGEVWEGAMCAGRQGLGNLCAIVDYNMTQSEDYNERILSVEPLREKWEAFRWKVIEIDGHRFDEIHRALAVARASRGPVVILSHTVRGKGVPFMEGLPCWNGSMKLRAEELSEALEALGTPAPEISMALAGTGFTYEILDEC